MLSPIHFSQPISFNLSHPPPHRPFFSAQSYLKPLLHKNQTDTRHFHCCSSTEKRFPLRKVGCFDDSSRFQQHPDSETEQRLSSSLLAIWLRSCHTLRDVKRVHSVIIRCSIEQDTYVVNNLICVYIRLGKLGLARTVFDGLSLRNVVTWSAILNGYLSFGFDDEALSLFGQSAENGIRVNGKMFVCVMNLCSQRKDLWLGRQVHAGAVKARLGNVIVASAVVKFYAQCGDLRSAFREFDRTSQKDVVCWTTMVTACAQQGRGCDAVSLLARMLREGFSPNEFTVCAALKACTDEDALKIGQALHGAIAKRRYKSDVFVGTSLVDMYAKCGRVSDAKHVFDRMRRRNTATWTSLIAGHARVKGLGEEAVRLFRAMTRRRVATNSTTVVSVIRACGAIRASLAGREMHARIVRNTIDTSLHVGNTLVWFYCRCGAHSTAARVLQGMPLRDTVSWTALISGFADASLESDALGLVRAMTAEGVEPNAYTYSAALKACARLAAAGPGRMVHSAARKAGTSDGSVFVGSALICMYAKCGRVADASQVFDEMPDRNSVSWRSMVVGLARNGRCRDALMLAYRMRAEGFEVGDYVVSEVLNACGNAGLGVERVVEYELRSG